MELVWNNPNPNRTIYRPPMWEVIGRNGATRVISDDELQAIAKRKPSRSAKDVLNQLQSGVPFFIDSRMSCQERFSKPHREGHEAPENEG